MGMPIGTRVYHSVIVHMENELPIQLEGEGATIGFNARYLLDVLGVMAADEIHIELNDGKSPTLFSEGEGSDYRCVLMPMRL